MAIHYQSENRIFTLHTARTTYQMKVDEFGFLLHLYYGAKVFGSMDYLLTRYDRGFCGNPPIRAMTGHIQWISSLRNIQAWA